MEERFLTFVASIMNVERGEINMETQYKEFDKWDSLMMLTLIMELENEFNTNIPMERLENVGNLNDLFELVK